MIFSRSKHSGASAFEQFRAVQAPDQIQFFGDEAGPSGLVAGADTRAVVTMEVFVKQKIIAEVGIRLELFDSAENGSTPVVIAQKNPCKARHDFLRHLEEVHLAA